MSMDMKTGEIMTEEEAKRRHGDSFEDRVTRLSIKEHEILRGMSRKQRRAVLAKLRRAHKAGL